MPIIRGSKTEIASIDEDSAVLFLEENHSQGALSVNKSVFIGLLYSGEIVGLIQFGSPRTALKKREYSTELLRLAFKKNTRIHGGASRLIKHYIRKHKPSDFFTYQDTTGDNSLVYQHAGMTLVKDGSKTKKQYLVAPGETIKTGSRKEVLGMPYAVRYGPDRILGTKLGEIFNADGSRKSNKQIFLEDLGWHVEETTGDSLWEWVDPNRTYYTYKITASDSDKYYYGVSHVKIGGASVEECLNDGYWGSGNKGVHNKFRNWKVAHKTTLQKAVLGLYSKRMEAFASERNLVGEKYREDPLCLNSTVGGGFWSMDVASSEKLCPIHGMVKHRGSSCRKCVSLANFSQKTCPIHGLVTFSGAACTTCTSQESITNKVCSIHGETKHRGETCFLCSSAKSITKKFCDNHGWVKHRGSRCATCLAIESYSVRACPIHGETSHKGEKCMACVVSDKIVMKNCEIHGLSNFQGAQCMSCVSSKSVSEKKCPKHGLSKHRGGKCVKCFVSDGVVVQECSIHGSVKHQGGKCVTCQNLALISMKICPTHGESKHRGNSCYLCISARKKANKK